MNTIKIKQLKTVNQEKENVINDKEKVINDKEKVIKDLLKTFENDPQNEVTFKLEDGEVKANKRVLMARCDYFATMFSNENFVESQSKVIEMLDVRKKPMKLVLKYIYTGSLVKYQDCLLTRYDKVKTVELLRRFLLDEPLNDYISQIFSAMDLIYKNHYFFDQGKDQLNDSGCTFVNVYAFALESFQMFKDLKFEDIAEKQTKFLIDFAHEFVKICDGYPIVRTLLRITNLRFINLKNVLLGVNVSYCTRAQCGNDCVLYTRSQLLKYWSQDNRDTLSDEDKAEAFDYSLTLLPGPN